MDDEKRMDGWMKIQRRMEYKEDGWMRIKKDAS